MFTWVWCDMNEYDEVPLDRLSFLNLVNDTGIDSSYQYYVSYGFGVDRDLIAFIVSHDESIIYIEHSKNRQVFYKDITEAFKIFSGHPEGRAISVMNAAP